MAVSARTKQPAAPSTLDRILDLPILARPGTIRQSNVTTWERCPRRYAFSGVFGLRGLRRGLARDAGSFGHHVVSTALLSKPSLAVAASCAATQKRLGTVISELRERNRPQDIDDTIMEANKGLSAGIRAYRMLLNWEKSQISKVVATEVAMSGSIPGVGWDVGHGRADIVLETDDGVWGLDLKFTTKKNLPAVIAVYARAIQPMEYTYLLRSMGYDCKGFIVAVTLLPNIRRKRIGKDDEQSVEDYLAECEEWWGGYGRHSARASERRGAPVVLLHRQYVPEEPPAWFLKRLRDYADGTPDDLSLDNYPPRESCLDGYSPCPYTTLCDESPASWARIAREHYTQDKDILDSDPNRFEVSDER